MKPRLSKCHSVHAPWLLSGANWRFLGQLEEAFEKGAWCCPIMGCISVSSYWISQSYRNIGEHRMSMADDSSIPLQVIFIWFHVISLQMVLQGPLGMLFPCSLIVPISSITTRPGTLSQPVLWAFHSSPCPLAFEEFEHLSLNQKSPTNAGSIGPWADPGPGWGVMAIIITSTIIYCYFYASRNLRPIYKEYFHHKWECSGISHVMSATLPSLVTSVLPAGAAVLPTSMLAMWKHFSMLALSLYH